ncbi:hypothetical protein TNCV_450761 [Trichonephila clavipes]|nr:hypothetical protein TNCV_450761 [Trichonephila clavipes]
MCIFQCGKNLSNIKFANKCVGELRTYQGIYCKTLNNDQNINYYNANNEDNINVKNNKVLDQVPDSPEADLKRLFNPAMVVEDNVVKAPTSEGVVDPKSGERWLVSLLLSGSRGRKSAPKGDSSRCVWRKQTAMSVRDNI